MGDIHRQLCFFYLIVVAAAVTVVQCQRRRINYALFTSGPDGSFDASGAIPAMELAEEFVFNSSVLKDYELRHSPIQDTLCNRTRSLDLFFATVAQSSTPVLGLLGCGCSVASEPVAEIIHHWNISQVAYDSSAIVLSESRFVNFFRTYPSDQSFAPAVISFLEFYGWNRIMFITEEGVLFTGILENLSEKLTTRNITSRNRMVPQSIPNLQRMLNMNSDFFFPEDDIRVIFINTYSDVARIVLCEAMRAHNLAGYPRYVWITYAWYQDEWWTSAVNNEPIECSDDELAQLLRQSLAIEVIPVPENPAAETNVGVTAKDFEKLYRERLGSPAAIENNYTFTFVAPIAYDAVWSLALALNNTDRMLNWPKDTIVQRTHCLDDGIDLAGFRLDNFTYDNSFVGCVIRWNLARTNFVGVSGPVTFDSNGTRKQTQITMLQYRSSQDPSDNASIVRVQFGHTNENVTFVYVETETNDTVFPDGVPPDGTPIEIVSTFHLSLVIIYDFIACLGLIFTTTCLIFNFAFRKRKVVRLTSPKLNYFIITGSYIMYLSIFIRLIPSTDETVNYVRCNLQVILTTVAYCLAFGTVLVKVGRVYHIFNNPSEKKKALLKDWHLAIVVLGITGAGLLMAILGWSIPELRAVPSLQQDGEQQTGRNELGVRIMYFVWQCSTNKIADVVSIVIFTYLGLLQVIGIILAIQTRKVKVKVLNDSKYIAALIYISSIVLIIIAIIRFTLGDYINVTEVFYSGGLILATTAFLSLTFIPKMVSLYRDPFGENIFSKHTSTIEVSRSGALTLKRKEDRVSELEARVKELEELLKENQDEETSSKRRSEIMIEGAQFNSGSITSNRNSTNDNEIHINLTNRGSAYTSTRASNGCNNLEVGIYSSSHSITTV